VKQLELAVDLTPVEALRILFDGSTVWRRRSDRLRPIEDVPLTGDLL
jgi:hypothetical protein